MMFCDALFICAVLGCTCSPNSSSKNMREKAEMLTWAGLAAWPGEHPFRSRPHRVQPMTNKARPVEALSGKPP